jgi:hypothetical protein
MISSSDSTDITGNHISSLSARTTDQEALARSRLRENRPAMVNLPGVRGVD